MMVSSQQQMAQWFLGLQNHLMRSSEWAYFQNIYNQFSQNPSDLSAVSQFHRDLWNISFADDNVRNHFLNAVREYHQNQLQLKPVISKIPVDVMAKVNALEEKGHTPAFEIAPEKIKAMREHFEKRHTKDLNGNISEYALKDCIEAPHFLEIANDPKVLSVVENYLGVTPTIKVIEAWWSHAKKEEAKDAQLYHLDYDDYKFCKLFIYLTDVNEDSGPHVYVEGTHTCEKVKDYVLKNSHRTEEFMAWYLKKLRKSDAEVKEYFGKEGQKLCGPAGTNFIVDTRGVHKGLLPKNTSRLLCQVTYGITPQVPVPPPRLNKDEIEKLKMPSTFQSMPYAFINRLFLDFGESSVPRY
ncbi:MAG: phytanoyl-CoA dioxygenase family protein [Deltaproteobacteria bacterium]|nr:phytanoyl-CoA dioxygenase family protein [Deltaproteobacteria bacterium]